MKRLVMYLLLAVVAIASAQGAENKKSFFSLYPVEDEELSFGWMSGQVVFSETELSEQEAEDLCLGRKQAPKGVKCCLKPGIIDIDDRYQYVYIMEWVPQSFGKNEKYKLQAYEMLKAIRYQVLIDDSAGGNG